MKNQFGTARPYAAAYIVLRRGDKVAMLLRGDLPWMGHHYGLPAGKVEIDERFSHAAIREAEEEIGLVLRPEQLRPILFVHRKDSGDAKATEWVDVLFEATEWEGEPFNAEPHMHDAMEWYSLDELPKNTIPAIKTYLEAINEDKTYLEYGWDD